MSALAVLHGPHIDWAELAPFSALTLGACVVLLVGLFRARFIRQGVTPLLTLFTLAVFVALGIWRWDHIASIMSGALRVDHLALILDFIIATTAFTAVILSWRSRAAGDAGEGEYYGLLLFAVLGMAILVSAQNYVTVFVGFELLSIPLYVMCASEHRREKSLESGLKYLIVGSVGSATLLYGLAFVYGATGSTDFSATAAALSSGSVLTDPLMLTGIALIMVGLAFKSSIAPFHQWTPDVYEGAPTPVTAFMAVATKAAAFGLFLRFFDMAVLDAQPDWAPWLSVLAVVTILVGNVGALGQSSLKRMLAYSSVAQAGYIVAGVVVGTRFGMRATVLYLIVYLAMNLAAFAVVVARERMTPYGDDIRSIEGLGAERPLLAWPMTIAMLSLAGIPATAGFVGKFYLIGSLVDGGYTWLGVVVVIGSMISLGYYLRVIAAMWMRPSPVAAAVSSTRSDDATVVRPAIAGAAPGAEKLQIEVAVVAVVFAAASIFFGIIPQPLFDLVGHAPNGFGFLGLG